MIQERTMHHFYYKRLVRLLLYSKYVDRSFRLSGSLAPVGRGWGEGLQGSGTTLTLALSLTRERG
jgi:hypothetical protein